MSSNRQQRDDFKKKKELDEARKAGTAPAETDEHGKDINPHIPLYITRTPFYLGMNQATLTHQRQDEKDIEVITPLDEYIRHKKGINKSAPQATKYRKGACKNCGSMTHTKNQCVERPRKLGAIHTNKKIMPDEHLPNMEKTNYDSKKDRWRGYNPAEYQKVIEEYQKVEDEKRRLQAIAQKEEKFDDKAIVKDSDESSDSEEDENADDKYAEGAAPIAKFDAKNRVSVRNLRIREDTAKYLRNLNVNSAHYDPKTRTMRANPYAGNGVEAKDLPYAGDNFVRYNDNVIDIAKRQMYAWDATNKGEDVHAQADPTLAEMMHKRHETEKVGFKDSHQSSVISMYGGEEHLNAPPKELLLAQSEHYVEYSKLGRVIKGNEVGTVRSKYQEDIFPGNHTAVFGSFWQDGKWGFACCHSVHKEAYCVGVKGKQAKQESVMMQQPDMTATLAALTANSNLEGEADLQTTQHSAPPDADDEGDDQFSHPEKKSKKSKKHKKHKKKKRKHDRDSDDDDDDDELSTKKIKKAMKKLERDERDAEALLNTDERSRKYGAHGGNVAEPTEAEMEAYRMKSKTADDPMAQFMN